MKYIKSKNLNSKELIYDGFEQAEVLATVQICFKGFNYQIAFNPDRGSKLHLINTLCGGNAENQIMMETGLRKVGMFNYYKNEEGLSSYFLVSTVGNLEFLIVYDYGERQPGRFQVILEGVWNIQYL